MNPGTDTHTSTAGWNPVLWLVIALPALAVVASFWSLALALSRGDCELPASYHWEGGGLAADDARLGRAAALGLRAELRVDAATQRCSVSLLGAAPAALRLDLTHPTTQGSDRHVLLQGSGGHYGAACAALPGAHWWVQLSDASGSWLLRARTSGALQTPLTLKAGSP